MRQPLTTTPSGVRSTTWTACDGASRVVRLRIDQRVGDLEVVLAAELDHALRAGRRLGLAQRPERHRLVDQEGRHEVGQPAHQAEGALGAQVEAAGEC
jgi:hypothetical protein